MKDKEQLRIKKQDIMTTLSQSFYRRNLLLPKVFIGAAPYPFKRTTNKTGFECSSLSGNEADTSFPDLQK